MNATSYMQIIRGERNGVIAYCVRAIAWWLSWLYQVGVWCRNRAYAWGWKQKIRVSAPVVCVGNLSLGGTGKTPVVDWIARYFRDQEYCVAILSRGYGSQSSQNDEAMMLEENLPDVPHLQGPDRVALARTAIEELQSDLLILDDGYQHQRLARDINIVLIDTTRPLKDEYLFPRGTLREPICELSRANVAIFTHCDDVHQDSLQKQRQYVQNRFPNLLLIESIHSPLALIDDRHNETPLSAISGKAVSAFCGIGNPASFRSTLERLNVKLLAFQEFPDHYQYQRADINRLADSAQQLPDETCILTTQKDLVKIQLGELGGKPLYAVKIGIQFLNQGQFKLEAILDSINRRSPMDAS